MRTPSDYDAIFASIFRSDWARNHRVVLSQGRDKHTLYTGFTVTEPHGQVTHCHPDCGTENREFYTAGKRVVITCKNCQSYCSVPLTKQDKLTVLGSCGLVKVPYPQQHVVTKWDVMPGAVRDIQMVTQGRKRKARSSRTRNTTQMEPQDQSQTAVIPLEQQSAGVTPASTPPVPVVHLPSSPTPLVQQASGTAHDAQLSSRTHLVAPSPLVRSVSSPPEWPTPSTAPVVTPEQPTPVTSTPRILHQPPCPIRPSLLHMAPAMTRSVSAPQSTKRQGYLDIELDLSTAKRSKRQKRQ